MDPYETLGVPRTADQATIKRAGKRKKVASHPDHGGDREKKAADQVIETNTLAQNILDEHSFEAIVEDFGYTFANMGLLLPRAVQ